LTVSEELTVFIIRVIITLMMEAVSSFKTTENIYQTTGRNIPKTAISYSSP
jgi:hypothetical protein